MKSKLKRLYSALAVVATASTVVPLFIADAAHAVGVPSGAAEVRDPSGTGPLSSGNSATDFTLSLPAGAACEGDTPNDFYTVASYMVPVSVDPATLTWDNTGPFPNGLGAAFRQPLYQTPSTSAYVGQATLDNPGSPRPLPGEVVNIPDFDFEVFSPGDIPAGDYNVGIACIAPGPTGPDQMRQFWNTTLTFATDTTNGGPAQVSWSVPQPPAPPVAPVAVLQGVGDGSMSVGFTQADANPDVAGFEYTIDGGTTWTPVPGGATASSLALSGLTNGTTYSVEIRSSNTVGTSPASNSVTATPNLQPVQDLELTPGSNQIGLTWAPPAGTEPTGYNVLVDPADGAVTVTGTSASFASCVPGTVYDFTVTPTYAAGTPGTPASTTTSGTCFSAQVLIQKISVERPPGQLVLTQVCDEGGPAPFTEWDDATWTGSVPDDANYPDYPNPADPTYPTFCGVNLGTATLVTEGDGAGSYYEAAGSLSTITVLDARDNSTGWGIIGKISDFENADAPGEFFSGNQLGWEPTVVSESGEVNATAGTPVLPGANPGLKDGKVLGSAPNGASLGIAELDADLSLLIPIDATNGEYHATLSFTVA